MNGLTPPYSPFVFQPHLFLEFHTWSMVRHCPSLEVCLFKPKAVITLQKTLFLQRGKCGADGWPAHGHKTGPPRDQKAPLFARQKYNIWRIIPERKAQERKQIIQLLPVFPSALPILRNSRVLLASHDRAWKGPGWRRPLSHKKGKRILTRWFPPSWTHQGDSGVGRRDSFHI